MSEGTPEIESYKDFRKFVKGKTSASMKEAYDSKYYEKMVGNKEIAAVYFKSKGLAQTIYTRIPIELAQIRRGDRVLDVGCGRGEIVFQTAMAGAIATGIDYSQKAIEIASGTRKCHTEDLKFRTRFVCGDATNMPFKDGSFDKAFILDVVEHISGQEFSMTLKEIRRLLSPRGIVVIHTTQNLWSRKYGFWLEAAACRILRREHILHPVVREYQKSKSDPDYDESKVFLHINEQSVLSLKLALALNGFRSRIWLENTGNPWSSRGDRASRCLSGIFNLLGLKYLVGSNIYAVAFPTKTPKSQLTCLFSPV
jgi:ubiquinone/menaquinone biosynthesis C-methylase UbiE